MPSEHTEQFVSWFRSVAPYVRAFSGRTFVVAAGGEVFAGEAAARLARDVHLLASLGVRVVLVHGARPQIEADLARSGETPRYHLGLRVTDAAALGCVCRASGELRLEIEALIAQGPAQAAVRVLGGNFITAKPLGVVEGVDYQYTGEVRRVDAAGIRACLEQDAVVLISPLGASPTGEIFNLAMEEVAETVAAALKADKLIFLTDTAGVVDAFGEVLRELTADEADTLMRAGDLHGEDVGYYLPRAVRACRSGVGRVHLVARQQDGSLLLELFTHEGVGTVITRTPLAQLRQARIDDVGALLDLLAPLETDGTLVRRSRELLEMEIDRFSIVDHDGLVIGSAALYPFGEDEAAELACLAVHSDYRQQGYGEELLESIEQRARRTGLKRLFVLTTRTAHWFLERGFRETTVEALPAQKQVLYNYQRRSKVFVKDL